MEAIPLRLQETDRLSVFTRVEGKSKFPSARNIVLYDHPTLRLKSQDVVEINENVQEFCRSMFETIRTQRSCVGLAANQVGSRYSIIMIRDQEAERPTVRTLLNPKIVEYSDETSFDIEGCMSVRVAIGHSTVTAPVKRHNGIRVTYRNEFFEECDGVFQNMNARIIQHEVDHLNGLYFFDRVEETQKILLRPKLQRVSKHARRLYENERTHNFFREFPSRSLEQYLSDLPVRR